jgi:hypothetical protein
MLKNSLKIVVVMTLAVFLFFVVTAFNRNSASWIISLTAGGGYFFEKSTRTFESLMIVISFNVFYYVFIFNCIKYGEITKKSEIYIKIMSVVGVLLCIFLYFYAGVFLYSIPLIN